MGTIRQKLIFKALKFRTFKKAKLNGFTVAPFGLVPYKLVKGRTI